MGDFMNWKPEDIDQSVSPSQNQVEWCIQALHVRDPIILSKISNIRSFGIESSQVHQSKHGRTPVLLFYEIV